MSANDTPTGWEAIVQAVHQELTLELPTTATFVRILFRLLLAMLLGGVLGWERGRAGKDAGLRTHMLVSMASTVFVLSALQMGMAVGDLSRVIQGILTGIGFIGAGVILKLNKEVRIHGLTTAASIWMTAGVGIAIGMGRFWSALLAVLLTMLVLDVLGRLELHWEQRKSNQSAPSLPEQVGNKSSP